MTARQFPRWSQLHPLMRMRRPALGGLEARLRKCLTIADLRAAGRRRAPRPVFDYVDGAADDEIGLRRARAAFRSVEFTPRVLVDVSDVDTSTSLLDRRISLPLVLAPTGFTRLVHHEGETAVARVAADIGVPYGLSTMGTTSIEQLVDAVPAGQKWFQLYVWKDRKASEELMERAAAAGYQALVVTVDSPIPGARLRDVRNGFSMPPTLTLRTVGEMATHPAWWFNLLTTRPPSFSSLDSWGMPLAELLPTLFDPSVTVADLAWIRSRWDGPLVVKGVQSVNDACRVVDAGADGVVLSNHGGRQLDRGIAPLELVGPTAAAVRQHATVMVDTGVMSGADVVAAVALGADAVLVGRAYLYGLLAGGEAGVRRALDILSSEIRRTMQFLGARTTEELTPDLVRLGHTWCHCLPDRG